MLTLVSEIRVWPRVLTFFANNADIHTISTRVGHRHSDERRTNSHDRLPHDQLGFLASSLCETRQKQRPWQTRAMDFSGFVVHVPSAKRRCYRKHKSSQPRVSALHQIQAGRCHLSQPAPAELWSINARRRNRYVGLFGDKLLPSDYSQCFRLQCSEKNV